MVLDYFVIHDIFHYVALTKFTVYFSMVATIEYQVRMKHSAAAIDWACAGIISIGYVVWILTLTLSDNTESFFYYMTFGTIFMMISNVFFEFDFKKAFICSTSIASMFVVITLWGYSPSFYYNMIFISFYLSCLSLTLYVNWNLNRERYRVFLRSLQAELHQIELSERGAALLRLSSTDALTSIANRRAIDEALRALWDSWRTEGTTFAVLLMDIDHFKRFNDTYGHQEGDRCLVKVAATLADATARFGATIGRFGGEEFVVLLRSADIDHASSVADALRNAVTNQNIPHRGRPDDMNIVTVSIGVAFSDPRSGLMVEKLVSEADNALYAAKANGRNRVCIFNRDLPQTVDETERVSALLETALGQGRLSLVYQPIVGRESGAIEAAEALMRLTCADGRSISPGVFIPIAERTDLIVELGRWAIRTACTDLLSSDLVQTVSVNISAVQLRMPGFACSVAAIVGETGIAPQRLALEVTEGVQFDNHPEILRNIDDLRTLGVQIWLDDFGAGFAGLSCLREMRFDVVKIDRAFVEAASSERGSAMLQAMIQLVREAGHRSLVEGIETLEQKQLVVHQGAELLQGFHLWRPMTSEAMKDLMREQASGTTQALSA